MTIPELAALLESIGEKKYRASQIFGWMSKGVCVFDEMTNLPKGLRNKLDEIAYIEKLEIGYFFFYPELFYTINIYKG